MQTSTTFGRGTLDWTIDDLDMVDDLPDGAVISFANLAEGSFVGSMAGVDDDVQPGGTVVQYMDFDSIGAPSPMPATGIVWALQRGPITAKPATCERTTLELTGLEADHFAFAAGSIDVELDVEDVIDDLFDEMIEELEIADLEIEDEGITSVDLVRREYR